MNINEFVNLLPHQAFDQLRKAVLGRHSREAAETFKAVEYLQQNPELIEGLEESPVPVIAKLIEHTGATPELCAMALGRFVQLQQMKANGVAVPEKPEPPENKVIKDGEVP